MADLYLSASTSETQGLTFIEAIASKTLVMARYDENLEDVIEEGKTGFFFLDNESFFDKLKYVLSLSDEQKETIIKQSYENNKKYSIDTYYERMIEVYHRAIRKSW